MPLHFSRRSALFCGFRRRCAASLARALPLALAIAPAPVAFSVPAPAHAAPGEQKPAAAKPAPTAAPAATEDNPLALRQESAYSFEFSKAEVQDIVKAISDITQQNFIVPERVKGQRITILCPRKVTAQEAYQVFFTALSANGISIVRSGKFYKLLDSKEAIKDNIPTCVDSDSMGPCSGPREQMVTVLLRLRYVEAAQVNTVARALLGKDGDITVFAPSNALIISEYTPNLKRVRSIIESLDVAGFDDALQIVTIQHASATEIADKLTQIFEITGNNQQRPPSSMNNRRAASVSVAQPGAEDGDVQISKIVADDRTNQLIIKANRRSFDAIRHLISKIDVPISEAEHGRVHVYYLENAKSEDLASTLSNLAQGSTEKKKGNAPQPPNAPRPQNAGTANLFEGEVKITADKATNSLLVMSSGHDYRALRSLIEKLDMPRRQVYVEAAILEVNIKDEESFGVDYHAPKQFAGDGIAGGSLGFLQSSQSTGGTSPTLGAFANGAQSFVGAAGGAIGGVFGKPLQLNLGNGVQATVPSFGALLKWLTTTSNANVLSTPHMLTTDNEEAHIEVGETVPFNAGLGGGQALAALAGGAAGGTAGLGGAGILGALGNNVQRIPVLLKLTLTPQINERNKIRLEIDQQVEDITGQTAGSSTPTTSKRAIKTVVVVDNQQTIVLGGLIKDSTTRSNSRVPYLGSIPLLGWLFKNHSTKMMKTNLMLILTPYIISSADDFQRIFERKMREHEEFAAEYYGHRKEFRAHIDYQKKLGPLGRLVGTMRREREKFENGGNGDGSDTLVGPEADKAGPAGASAADGRASMSQTASTDADQDEAPSLGRRGHASGDHEAQTEHEGAGDRDRDRVPDVPINEDASR